MFDSETNECESNPCENGGVCTDHLSRYTCQWSRHFTGDVCQYGMWHLQSPNKGPFPANRAAARFPLKYMAPPAAADPLAVAARIWPPHNNSNKTPALLCWLSSIGNCCINITFVLWMKIKFNEWLLSNISKKCKTASWGRQEIRLARRHKPRDLRKVL